MTTPDVTPTPAKRGRGGRRAGAGRPPIHDVPMVQTTVLLELEQLEALDRWCNAHGTHRSQALRWAIGVLIQVPRAD